jgi:hypothetical protein
MTQLHTVARFVSRLEHHLASAFPDSVPICHLTSAAFCGPAQPADQSPKPDGDLPLKTQRDNLIAQAERARNLRRNKLASLIEAELREVTLEILWDGMQPKGV